MIYICKTRFYDMTYLMQIYTRRNDIETTLTQIKNIFAYNDYVDVSFFKDAFHLAQGLGCEIPRWVKGVSYRKNIFLVQKDGWLEDTGESWIEILFHEYVHVAVANTFKSTCPPWLNEGFAMYFSGQTDKLNTRDCSSQYSYYNCGYEDQGFYIQCAYIIKKLMNKWEKSFLVNHAQNCLNFSDDPIFGKENLLKLN